MTNQKIEKLNYLLVVLILSFASCKKGNSLENTATETSAIAIVASESAAGGVSADSVYLLHSCSRGSSKDTTAEAELPANITSYLTANYAGYSFNRAFVVTDNSVTTGYVVVIFYNDKPVGLEFDSAGNFVRVLEQRENGDLYGRGWHHGGRFGDRAGLQKDTIALNELPSSILSYFNVNFSGDTLVKAFRNRDSSYLVVSSNNGIFAMMFDLVGNFINRIQLPSKSGRAQAIDQISLPANVLSYLNTTYPNYVFKKAFTVTANGTTQGYIVVIDANNTKYALQFDTSGNFVRAKTIY